MTCANCPRALTAAEEKADLDLCEVCRGVRKASRGKAFRCGASNDVHAARKDAADAAKMGGSWWRDADRETFQRRIAERFANGTPPGAVIPHYSGD